MEWYRNLDGTAEVKVFWNENVSGKTEEYLNHSYEMFLVDGWDLIPIAGYRYIEKDDAVDLKTHVSMRAIEVKAPHKPVNGRWVEASTYLER